MKERAQNNIRTVVKRAQMISLDVQTTMWEQGILGEETPDKLRSTVLFLTGLNVGLRVGDKQYNLHRDGVILSQLQFKRNDQGVRCLVYTEDSVTKTNDGGLNSMHKERKIVWVYPSQNVVRCPVRIIDKYISLLPPVRDGRKPNFYLQSLNKFTPAQWYGEQVVGLNTLKTIMGELTKNAKIEGFFTNHSLRQNGANRLFQAGVDCKLVKEFMGHSSDAID